MLHPKLSEEDGQRFRELVSTGRKIDAIKLYRRATGVDLAEAKEAVEALAGINAKPDSPEKVELTLILHALQRHGAIEAIKRYREQTGCGLREAKLAVDEIARQHGIRARTLGCAGLLAFCALAATAGAVLIFS